MSDKNTVENRKKVFENYGFDKFAIEPLELPTPMPDGANLSPTDSAWSKYFIRVTVKDLEHLKQLVGVPSSLAAKGDYPEGPEDGEDIYSKARNAILGDWSGKLKSEPDASKIEKLILSSVKDIPVFLGTDLVVEDGKTVELGDASTYYFDNITVHGSGQINLKNHVKLVVSGTVTHI
jgi:hypothetical protein